jgi:hypothetical protein
MCRCRLHHNSWCFLNASEDDCSEEDFDRHVIALEVSYSHLDTVDTAASR